MIPIQRPSRPLPVIVILETSRHARLDNFTNCTKAAPRCRLTDSGAATRPVYTLPGNTP